MAGNRGKWLEMAGTAGHGWMEMKWLYDRFRAWGIGDHLSFEQTLPKIRA